MYYYVKHKTYCRELSEMETYLRDCVSGPIMDRERAENFMVALMQRNDTVETKIHVYSEPIKES